MRDLTKILCELTITMFSFSFDVCVAIPNPTNHVEGRSLLLCHTRPSQTNLSGDYCQGDARFPHRSFPP